MLFPGLSDCGFPGAPAHSSVDFNTARVRAGTVARYGCDRGFELLGPARRICGQNGTWTPQGIPFCGERGEGRGRVSSGVSEGLFGRGKLLLLARKFLDKSLVYYMGISLDGSSVWSGVQFGTGSLFGREF